MFKTIALCASLATSALAFAGETQEAPADQTAAAAAPTPATKSGKASRSTKAVKSTRSAKGAAKSNSQGRKGVHASSSKRPHATKGVSSQSTK